MADALTDPFVQTGSQSAGQARAWQMFKAVQCSHRAKHTRWFVYSPEENDRCPVWQRIGGRNFLLKSF